MDRAPEPIKEAFHHLSRFGHAAKKCALPIWRAAVFQSERGLQWLRLRPQARTALFSAGMGIVTLLLLIFSGVTAAVAALAAWFALIRHFGQTDADRQRRITESFSKAVEQLGSDKLEVRLGGIYSLERISKESPDDYWTVMENLTAFVRERSRRNEQRVARRAYFLWQEAGQPDGRDDDFWTAAAREEELVEPAADITAVLLVIKRRSKQSREREDANDWRFDLSGAILKRYNLVGAHFEGANLNGAHFEGADFNGAHLEEAHLSHAHLEGARLDRAHLEGAGLSAAHLEGARLDRAHLERANLNAAHLEGTDLPAAHLEGAVLHAAHFEGAALLGAHLEGAALLRAHLEGAILLGAHLKGADFNGAHLEGADFAAAVGLSAAHLLHTHGDAATRLPDGVARPAHWPEFQLAAITDRQRR